VVRLAIAASACPCRNRTSKVRQNGLHQLNLWKLNLWDPSAESLLGSYTRETSKQGTGQTFNA